VLSQGSRATPSDVNLAVESLKTDDPEVVDWDHKPDLMFHRGYSERSKKKLQPNESNDILVVVLGQDGQKVFDDILGLSGIKNRTMEKEISSLTGAQIIHDYSMASQRSGFARDSINLKVAYVREPEHLDEHDPSDYLSIMVLDGEGIEYSDKFIDWLEEGVRGTNSTIPLIYSFSHNVSIAVNNLDENQASLIAASWILSHQELLPQKQIDYCFQAFNKLFFEDLGNTNNKCRDMMNQDFINEYNKRDEELPNKDLSALLKSCKLTSAGHNYCFRYIGKILDLHKNCYSKSKQLILPNAFSGEDNPRAARNNWLGSMRESLIKANADGKLVNATRGLIEIHDRFDKLWKTDKGIIQNLSSDNEINDIFERWIGSKEVTKSQIKQLFNEDQGNYGKVFYGGIYYSEKQKFAMKYKKFNEFDAYEGLAKNFAPKYWTFFKRLFNITDSNKYGIEARNLEPEFRDRLGISDISKIRNRIGQNILCEIFLDFKKMGGVLQ